MKLNEIGLILDRDGTINVEVDFLKDPDEIQLIPGAARAIREANEVGIKTCVVSNQSGIARGILSESQLDVVHQRLLEVLSQEGAHIDRIYYCPHHPDFGAPPYRKVCTCRKPNTGMLLMASQELGIILEKSFVVGDRCCDIQSGKQVGCGTVLVLTGYGEKELKQCEGNTQADYVAKNLFDGWQYIKNKILL